MEHLQFDEIFPAPRAKVFAYFSDPKKLGRLWGAKWTPLKPGQDPAQPNGVGMVREVKAGGFRFEETVTAFEPNQLIEYEITAGANVKDHHARIAFSDAPGGTRVEYSIRFEPKIAVTGRMLAATMRLSWRIGAPKVMRELEAERGY